MLNTLTKLPDLDFPAAVPGGEQVHAPLQSSDHIYHGTWKYGAQTGYGILLTRSGDIYQGEFLNGLKHGHG